MRTWSSTICVAIALLAAACSKSGGGDEAKPTTEPSAKATAPEIKTAEAPAQKPAAVAAPAAQGYDLAAIKSIPDNCSSPTVILATAPRSVGASYPWNISRQALLANQQFKITAEPPSVPGQVSLATYDYGGGGAYALVAKCNDGGTCNRLAAMYKAIIRSSNPQVFCGKVPGISASPVGSAFGWNPSPEGNLPSAKDITALCARLDACLIATDRSTAGDPFVECQKAPSKFKTACARKYPCAEVLACMND